jgi:hypothetical protein
MSEVQIPLPTTMDIGRPRLLSVDSHTRLNKLPPILIPLEWLLPVDVLTRDNVPLNEQRTLDQSEYKNKYSLPCYFLREK